MIQGEQLQLLVEATKDRIVGVPGITSNGLVPLQEPGVEAIILRDIHRTVATVENITKLALFPRRKTDLPKTSREAYEEKYKYVPMQVFNSYETLSYPTWDQLTPQQQEVYAGDKTLYIDGSLDWDLMTRQQKAYLNSKILHVPNKVGDAEKIDGKGRSYIKLYNREVIKINSVTLASPVKTSGTSLWGRVYTEDSIIPYKREGAFQLVPQMAAIGMLRDGSAYMATGAMGYGMAAPKIPQLIKVDYTYGLEEIPLDLQDAIGMLAAIKVFENVNLLTTQGILSFAVQGFSANFSKGMYFDVMERYKDRAEKIINAYQFVNMTGW